MLRLNNIYKSTRRYIFKVVAGTLIIAGLAEMIRNIGEEVYRGNIDDQEVVYEEGIANIVETKRDFLGNKMTVSKGNTTYILLDEKDKTPISWKQETAPEYNADKLEKVVIKTSSETRIYDIDDINAETLDGKHAGVVFDEANTIYNNLRTHIREQLRSDYQKRLSPIEKILK